jgi:hypothetical protein
VSQRLAVTVESQPCMVSPAPWSERIFDHLTALLFEQMANGSNDSAASLEGEIHDAKKNGGVAPNRAAIVETRERLQRHQGRTSLTEETPYGTPPPACP